MCPHAPGVLDVANGQKIKLLDVVVAGDVDGKKDRPCNADADEEDVAQDPEVAQKEEAIKGAMVKDKGIWDLEEGYDPIEPTIGEDWSCRAIDS